MLVSGSIAFARRLERRLFAAIPEYADPQEACRHMASTQLNGRMVRGGGRRRRSVFSRDESAMVTGSSLINDGGWSVGK